MPIINWYKIYSVNNEVIDNHHKKLFEIFNELYDSCEQKRDDAYAGVLDELMSYAKYHFAAEEQYMKDIGYQDIDVHIHEHGTFTERLQQLKAADMISRNDFCKELILFLGNWLLGHEIEQDRKFADQLADTPDTA